MRKIVPAANGAARFGPFPGLTRSDDMYELRARTNIGGETKRHGAHRRFAQKHSGRRIRERESISSVVRSGRKRGWSIGRNDPKHGHRGRLYTLELGFG